MTGQVQPELVCEQLSCIVDCGGSFNNFTNTLPTSAFQFQCRYLLYNVVWTIRSNPSNVLTDNRWQIAR